MTEGLLCLLTVRYKLSYLLLFCWSRLKCAHSYLKQEINYVFLKKIKLCVCERGELFTSWLFSLLFFHLPCFGFLQAFYENFHQVHAKNNNICQGLNIHCKQVEIIISLRWQTAYQRTYQHTREQSSTKLTTLIKKRAIFLINLIYFTNMKNCNYLTL